jgi:hypothetical protein
MPWVEIPVSAIFTLRQKSSEVANNARFMMTYVVQKQNLDCGKNSILLVLMQEIGSLTLPDFLAESTYGSQSILDCSLLI